MTVSLFISQLCTVELIILGVYRIADGEMSMGALIACNILTGRAMALLLQIAALLTKLQYSKVSFNILDTLMHLPTENERNECAMDFGNLESSFKLDNLCFSYPQAEQSSLENITLTVKAGEKIGIIGAMGSGKSTLARLLAGLYEPDSDVWTCQR